MGRRATKSGDIVSVNINGKGVAWCDGVFSGNTEIVKHARVIAEIGLPVYINGNFVDSGSDSAVGAFASIYSYNPDQAIIFEAPDEVIELVNKAAMALYDLPES